VSREALDYSARHAPRAPAAGFDVDQPIAGFYRMKLVSGAVYSGIRIWFGPPHDPETGDEMDRSHRWQAERNGNPIDLERAWPKCAADPIDEAEYRHLTATEAWGKAHAPTSPQANPSRRIDLLTAPLPL